MLPFYSEITLVATLALDTQIWLVWFVATAGNTLGAAVNWVLGRYFSHFESRAWFPFKHEKLHKAQHWFQRWGVWSLLLAWLPIGGDMLTFVAGVMRVRFSIFFILTTIGKGARYAVLIFLYLHTATMV